MDDTLKVLRAKAKFFGVTAYPATNGRWLMDGEKKHLDRIVFHQYEDEYAALKGFLELWKRKQRGEPWRIP